MPKLVSADEYFYHQIPEPHLNVVTHHEHWRESYFFALHPPDGPGDVVILAMAVHPQKQMMDAVQLGVIDGQSILDYHIRPYDGDPHTTVVGPISVDIVKPFRTIKLTADKDSAQVGMDLTFTART